MDHGFGNVAFLEHGLHEFVGEHGHRVEQFLALGLGLVAQVGGDFLDADVVALLAVEVDGLHGDQVDHALQVAFQADGHLDHDRVQVQLVAQLLGDALRVGTGAVALVDEGDPRHLVPGHLPVDSDGLRLDPADRAEDEHRAVEHPQGPLHLDGEVDVPGGVDDVDVIVFPGTVGGGRLDGDAALPLQFHVVHGRADTVLAAHLVDGVNPLGEEQDAFRQRGFARIDVGADADVPYFAQVFFHHAFLGCRLQAACLGRKKSIKKGVTAGSATPCSLRWQCWPREWRLLAPFHRTRPPVDTLRESTLATALAKKKMILLPCSSNFVKCFFLCVAKKERSTPELPCTPSGRTGRDRRQGGGLLMYPQGAPGGGLPA